MTKLKDIQKVFPISEIKHGDLGDYIEIYIQPHIYIHFFDNPGLTTQLLFNDKFVSFLHGVKDVQGIEEVSILFTGKNVYP